jgi:hypothetical protein
MRQLKSGLLSRPSGPAEVSLLQLLVQLADQNLKLPHLRAQRSIGTTLQPCRHLGNGSCGSKPMRFKNLAVGPSLVSGPCRFTAR